MKPITSTFGGLFAAIIFAGVAHSASAQNISVLVNDKPVSFAGSGPIQQKGAVLVPLRGVFEALGAKVTYDQATKTVTAQKGQSLVSLTVGSGVATVNGKSEPLGQPAQVASGSNLVPLRFVAEALGNYVQWVAATNTVEIQTPEAHLSTLPAPPTQVGRAGVQQVVGQLTGIYTNTVPEQITIRVNGENTVVPLSPSSQVLVRDNDQSPVTADLNSLQVGDHVRVQVASDGTASTIEAIYGEVVGTVKSIIKAADGSYVVNLNDGSSIQMIPDADAQMAGRTIQFDDIMAAEKVRIRTDQSNKIGYSIAVVTGDQQPTGPAPAQSSSATISDDGDLVASEYPPAGATVTTLQPPIYGVIQTSNVAPVSRRTVKLRIDGQDVTPDATVIPSLVMYQPAAPLAAGEHEADLFFTDATGGQRDHRWTFICSAHRNPLTFTSNYSGRQVVLQPGDVMDLNLKAPANGTAFATVAEERIPLEEYQPGVYTGRMIVKRSDRLQNAAIAAHFTGPDSADYSATLQQVVSIERSRLLVPLISTPCDGESVHNAVTVAGISTPGSMVNVSVNYSAKALGLIDYAGTAAQTQVIADRSGRWQTESIPIAAPSSLLSSHGTDLTISAQTVDALGKHSKCSLIKVCLQ